jgi:DNA-binding NtrC family response regulator
MKYSYPGNVRELENIVERAVALCDGETIETKHLPADLLEIEVRKSLQLHSLLLKNTRRLTCDRCCRLQEGTEAWLRLSSKSPGRLFGER